MIMRLGPSSKAPETVCPFCGYVFSGFTPIGDDASEAELKKARPKEGAVSVCIRCASVAIFNADGSSRRPTYAELIEVMAMPTVQRAVASIHTLRRRGKRQ